MEDSLSSNSKMEETLKLQSENSTEPGSIVLTFVYLKRWSFLIQIFLNQFDLSKFGHRMFPVNYLLVSFAVVHLT